MATMKAKKGKKKSPSMKKAKSLQPVKPLLTFSKIKQTYWQQSAAGTTP
jgi:hypothetical protein